MEAEKLIEILAPAGGVSGRENEVYPAVYEILKDLGEVKKDSLGNITCTMNKGASGKRFLLDAHIDKIGLIVKYIDDEGFVKADSCGGIDWRVLAGEEVIIYGKEPVKGVVCSVPPHLSSGDSDKALTKDTLIIDTGMSGDNLKKTVSLGDRIFAHKPVLKLISGRVSSPALDNRAGVAAIIRAAEILKENGYKGGVSVALSVQEEVGTRGAGAVAFAEKPDEALVVDVSFALSPGLKGEDCGVLSKGPMIGFSPILDENITAKLCETAEEKGIAFQREIMGGRTGTNADVVSNSAEGVKTGLVSIPLRYMHTGAEVADLGDIENTAKLLAAYIEKGGVYND